MLFKSIFVHLFTISSAKIILFPYIIYKNDKKFQEFVTLRKVFL